MNFLQKKLWLAQQKFRFLRLPIEKRVRLEVTTDGRHLTFLLTALGEAGYGVHVVNSQILLRELICLRKSVPLPFVIGGKERECGISMSDRKEFSFQGSVFSQNSVTHSPLFTLHSSHILLDYDYFSGLATKTNNSEAEELTAIECQGRCEKEQPRVGPKGEGVGTSESKVTESTTRQLGGCSVDCQRQPEGEDERERASQSLRAAGQCLAGQAGAPEPDSLTSKLAHEPVSESLTRSASIPASLPATSHSLPATAPKALRMPYFMHPSVYHRGLHKSHSLTRHPPQRRRRFRLGFFGTHDREFYTTHYHFPGMSRFEILEVFLKRFSDRMALVSGAPEQWPDSEIAVSIDGRGGDRQGKSFLSQEHYFAALRECDFVLSPPGWCMPLSHNLIETMFCGAIPITNAGAFMAPPLEDGRNCLVFSGEADLIVAFENALAMSDEKIEKMRGGVRNYYEQFLDPMAFGQLLGQGGYERILLNAEERSVNWGREFQEGVGAFMAKYC